MGQPLFPLKYRLRKTGEPVEIVAWETTEKGARCESDWVSYIDSAGVEHIKEHLTLEWDFVIDSPFESMMKQFDTKMLPEFDLWETRRYDMVQRQVIDKGICIQLAVECADKIISSLMPKEESIKKL